MKLNIDRLPDHHRHLPFGRVDIDHADHRIALERSKGKARLSSGEMTKSYINQAGRGAPMSMYKDIETLTLYVDRRPRMDIEILPGGYRYGRISDRSLKGFVDQVVQGLSPSTGMRM